MAKKHRYYVYIFVDQDKVEPIYQAVQAAHVAMVIGQKMNKKFNAKKIYYQICKMPFYYNDGRAFAEDLRISGLKVEEFYEPDVDRVIAIGTHPIRDDRRDLYDDIRAAALLSFG